MVTIDKVCRPGWIISRRHNGIELELLDGCVDSVYTGVLIDVEGLVVRETEVWINAVRIEDDRLRKVENVLIEKWHLDAGMSVVEIDRALKIPTRHRYSNTRLEVIRDVACEIVEKNEKFAVSRREGKSLLIKVDHGSASILERLKGR